jgi:butyryl-CoA dehydrogenase
MIRDAVRAFAQEQLWPNAMRTTTKLGQRAPLPYGAAQEEQDHRGPATAASQRHVSPRVWRRLGAYGICVPEEFGGANLDYVTLAVVLEEIAPTCGRRRHQHRPSA